MTHAFNIIEEIAGTKGKAKQGVLRSHEDNEEFMRVLTYALDPRRTYGIGKKTLVQVEGMVKGSDMEVGLTDEIWEMLDLLSTRELSGGAALDRLLNIRAKVCDNTWEMIRRILLKDLRASCTATLVNTVWPGTIEVFKVMLAEKYDKARVKSWPVAMEIKHDGVRVTTIVDLDKGTARTLSREGNEFTTFEHVKVALLQACALVFGPQMKGRLVFDGEMISGAFNKTVGDVHRTSQQAEDAVYHIFDMLSGEEFFEGSDIPQMRRRTRLENFFTKLGDQQPAALAILESVIARNDAEVQSWYDKWFSEGFEGAIVKMRDEPYQNRRCYGFMKLKNESSEDLKIVDWEPGTGKYEGMIGAVIVDFNGVRVNVGSGLSDKLRAEDPELMMGRIIEVRYHEVTPDGSLRHPRFKRFRDTLKKGVKE